MKSKHSKRNTKNNLRIAVLAICVIVVFAVVGLLAVIGNRSAKDTDATANTTVGTTTEPPVYKMSSATILSTGDIMVHEPQLTGAKVAGKNEWDFSAFFKEASTYFNAADFAVANLETTFAGNENRKYSGYPVFNTPDSLIDTIKASGLSMVLTANNHCYDTGATGFARTQQVLKEKGVAYIGSRPDEQSKAYAVQDINGIKVGMAAFTYETGRTNGIKSINGIPMKAADTNLLHSFSYGYLDDFYAEVDTVLAGMKQDGAEVTMFYVHWGDEYKTTENSWQNKIAQALCNKGIDVIVGGHPHVIQPMELLTSEDGAHQTICLYSAGNAVSNQRQERMVSCPSGHTEDGLFFYCTFDKYSDGKIVLSAVDIIPTWVNKYLGGSGYQYTIYPLENANDGAEKYGLTGSAATKSKKSYERTKAIVAEGLTACQKAVGCELTFPETATTTTP